MAQRPKARTNRCPADHRPDAPPLPGASTRQSGFALVAVIWTLGLITLLGMAVIVGARYRTKTSSNYASVTAAEMAAESAVNLAISAALTAAPEQAVNFPLRCRLPGGERATITVEEETGKVDLNTASLAALTRLFTALAGDQSTGTRLAAQIVEFRKPKTQGCVRSARRGTLHDHHGVGPDRRHPAAVVSDGASLCHGSLRQAGARHGSRLSRDAQAAQCRAEAKRPPSGACPRAAA